MGGSYHKIGRSLAPYRQYGLYPGTKMAAWKRRKREKLEEEDKTEQKTEKRHEGKWKMKNIYVPAVVYEK